MRIVSGIRPTGELHIGNYFGAIKQFISYQQDENNQCFFFVADLHALTTQMEEKADLDETSIEVLRWYLACGVDPERAVIYRQSEVPEIPYLSLLLGMVAPEGELRRCTTYKEKAAEAESKRNTISFGLLGYPVLMAADVLFCNADVVPVGEDQLQHLEIIREIARRFNTHISSSWLMTEPAAMQEKSVRVPGLSGGGKMSKSASGDDCIFLNDSRKDVKRKVGAAVTDSGPVAGQPPSPPVANLFQLMSFFCSPDEINYFTDKHERAEQRFYGEMKAMLAEKVSLFLEPIQERYSQPECSTERIRQMLFENTDRVRVLARRTLSAVQADFHLHRENRGDL